MILNANQRGSAQELARHLLNTRDNDHVELHDLRGFISDDLHGALLEAEAISMGTKCINHLFSVSLNPPDYADVPVQVFETAIARLEATLGLEGQPRAIVFHEKEGRRHAHAVWSRIDANEMTAIKFPFYKRHLTDLSKQLFLENGWPLPEGLQDHRKRDPLKFTFMEWQQAKRTGLNPKETKALLKECWNVSDSRSGFEAALQEKGFWLAQGDKRGYVAVDWRGEVYSLSRAIGAKKEELTARLGDGYELLTVQETNTLISAQLTPKIIEWAKEAEAPARKMRLSITFQSEQAVQRQRGEREKLRLKQEKRWLAEEKARAARVPKGMRGLWGWITGKNRKLRQINEAEIKKARSRDLAEKQALTRQQIVERQNLQKRVGLVRQHQQDTLFGLAADVAKAIALGRVPEDLKSKARDKRRQKDREKSRDRGPDFNR